MSHNPKHCRYCHDPLPATKTAKAGRPAEFCTPKCRRLHTDALRAARRDLDRAADELARAQADHAGLNGFPRTLAAPRRMSYWKEALDRARHTVDALL